MYFPGYGWVPFDPTPGWTPSPYTAPVQRWIFSTALDRLPSLPWGATFATGAAFLGAALGGLTILVVPIILVVLAFLLRFLLRRARHSQPSQYSALDHDPNRLRILAAYRAGQRRLGLYRAPPETPQELARRIARDDWGELTTVVEGAAYRTAPPSPALAQRALELLRQLPRRPLREVIHSSVGTIRPRLPVTLHLPRVKRFTPRAPRAEDSEKVATGRGFVLGMSALIGLIALIVATGVVFLIGGSQGALLSLFGPIPAFALTAAMGGGFIASVGLRVARDNWVRWILIGTVGMTLFAVVALIAAEIALVALFVPSYQWFHPDNLALARGDVVFLLPITIPIGFLMGFGIFGAAGWLRGRWLASKMTDD